MFLHLDITPLSDFRAVDLDFLEDQEHHVRRSQNANDVLGCLDVSCTNGRPKDGASVFSLNIMRNVEGDTEPEVSSNQETVTIFLKF